MSIEIMPTGAALGAEISGVDLAHPLDDATFAAIERAYNDHGVIFFRDQRITPPQQVAFTRRFGEIEFNIFGERWSVPGSPEIVVVSNVTEDGRSTDAAQSSTLVAASELSHSRRRRSTAIRRSGIRSSGHIPIPGANACTSCAMIASGSRGRSQKTQRP
jgi:alpha-ketoglutarate-dependent taurine dioxygenase